MIIDTEILRVILIVLGGIILLMIYLWERLRRDEVGEMGWQESLSEAAELKESNLSSVIANEYNQIRNTNSSETISKSPVKSKNRYKCTDDDDDYWYAGTPQLVLQLNISAKNDPFNGFQVLKALEITGFKANERGIFNYYSEDGKDVLFSVASMVKPGIISVNELNDFTTPGLIIFADLSGIRDGIALFSNMLSKAKVMATELGGEVQDDNRCRLTNQTIEHIHSQIFEYQRQIQLASRRCGKI